MYIYIYIYIYITIALRDSTAQRALVQTKIHQHAFIQTNTNIQTHIVGSGCTKPRVMKNRIWCSSRAAFRKEQGQRTQTICIYIYMCSFLPQPPHVEHPHY